MENFQHPDITACERTGYPSWMRDEEPEEETRERGITDVVGEARAALDEAERIMRDRCAELTEMLNAEVIAIRDYGIHIWGHHADFVLSQPGARLVKREYDDTYHYEARCEIEGIPVFALMEEAPTNE